MIRSDSRRTGSLLVFTLLLACFSTVVFAHEPDVVDSAQPVLRIAIGRSPPAGKEKYSGYLSPVLRELFSRSGIRYELVTRPARRVLDDANAGNLDAAISPSRNVGARFPQLVTLPESIVPLELAGLFTRDDMKLSSVEDFFDYRLAYVRGWRPAERLFGKHADVQLVRNPAVLMSMLMHDRVDVVFYASYPGKYMASELGLKNLKVSDFYTTMNLYLHLNKRHASLLPVLELQLETMKADGSLDSILLEHGVRQPR